MVQGQEYSHITDLDDTPRNRTKVQRLEAEAHRLVLDGRAADLRLQVQPFSSASDKFITWTRGEYSAHPNTAKRLAVSMTSLKLHFGKRPLSSVTAGDIEDFKSLRRAVHKVREVTVRHDLHALSLLFQYGRKHNWCKANVVDEVEIPSDSEAVRMHVLTVAPRRQRISRPSTSCAPRGQPRSAPCTGLMTCATSGFLCSTRDVAQKNCARWSRAQWT